MKKSTVHGWNEWMVEHRHSTRKAHGKVQFEIIQSANEYVFGFVWDAPVIWSNKKKSSDLKQQLTRVRGKNSEKNIAESNRKP